MEKRLPLFLESDIYVEFRLAHIISQMEEVLDDDEIVIMKLDYSLSQTEIENKVDEEDILRMTAKKLTNNALTCAFKTVSLKEDQPLGRDVEEIVSVEKNDADRLFSDTEEKKDMSLVTDAITGLKEQDGEEGNKYHHEDEKESLMCENDDEEAIFREDIGEGYLELKSVEVPGMEGVVTFKEFKAMVEKDQKVRSKNISWHGEEDDGDEEDYYEFGDVQSESKEELEWDSENSKEIMDNNAVMVTSADKSRREKLLDEEEFEECDGIMRSFSSDDIYGDNISLTDEGSIIPKAPKAYLLNSLKGVEQFKASLAGLPGEKKWNLWVDIEKMRLINDDTLLEQHLNLMKNRYFRSGSLFELTESTKEELGLSNSDDWVFNTLCSVQVKLVEPLLRYWVPTFLTQRKLESSLRRFCTLEELQSLQPALDSYPHQRNMPLLPFRPHECHPRCFRLLSKSSNELNVQHQEPHLPENELLYTPEGHIRHMYPRSKRHFFLNLNRRKHWRQVLEEEEARIFQYTGARKSPALLHQLSSLGETSEDYDKLGMQLGLGNVPPILSAMHKTGITVNEGSTAEVCGGERMEGLLQALDCDNEAGRFFIKELEKHGNQLWLNAFKFWKDLQIFHEDIFTSQHDLPFLVKEAKHLYSEYISSDALSSIQCMKSLRDDIFQNLNHPTEETFDDAEHLVLMLLYAAWMHVIERDLLTFEKIKKIFVSQSLDQGSKYMEYIRKRGLMKKKFQEPVKQSHKEVNYNKSVRDRLPSGLKDLKLDDVMQDTSKAEGLKKFMSENFASLDQQCLADIEAYKKIPRKNEARVAAKAMDIKKKYYNKKYLFGPNSPAGKDGQDKIVELAGGMQVIQDPQGAITEVSIYELEKYVRKKIDEKWMPLYLQQQASSEDKKDRTSKKSSKSSIQSSRGSTEVLKKLPKDTELSAKKQHKDAESSAKHEEQLMDKRKHKNIEGDRKPQVVSKKTGLDSIERAGTAGAPGAATRSWNTDLYTWAFDREKVLNLFPQAKCFAFLVEDADIARSK